MRLMRTKARHAELLERFVADVVHDPSHSAPPELDDGTMRMLQLVALVEARSSGRPARLGEAQSRVWLRVLAQARAARPVDRPIPRTSLHSVVSKRVWLGLATALLIALSMGAAWPVLGETFLKHVAPREVSRIPAWTRITQVSTPGPLQKQANFTPLMPTHLPSSCTLERRTFEVPSKAIDLVYSCVLITEQVGQGIQQPPVGIGSTREITVNGDHALFTDGIWVGAPNEQPQWKANGTYQLVFEHGGLIVHLLSGRRSAQDNPLTKEELIRVAESMR